MPGLFDKPAGGDKKPAGKGLFGGGGGGGGGKKKPAAKPSDSDSDDSDSSGDESSTVASSTGLAGARDSVGAAAAAAGDLPKYVVKQRAIMRQGYEANSKPAKGKPLKIGDVVQALETKVNDAGILRIRVQAGWVSEKARDGTVLLAKEGDADSGSDDDSDDSDDDESESSAAPQPAPTPAPAPAKKAVKKGPPAVPKKKGPPAVPKTKNAPAPKRVTQNTGPTAASPADSEPEPEPEPAKKDEAGEEDDSEDDEDSSSDDSDDSDNETESSAAPQPTRAPAKKAPARKAPPAVPTKKAVPADDDEEEEEEGDDSEEEEEQEELPRYEVKNLAIVRQGFEVTSKPAATKLKVGQILPALELRKNDKGVLRIRVAAGWVSEKAGSGQVILQEIKPLVPETEWEQLDGPELTEARSPKAAAEVIASGSQVPKPLEPPVEEGSAEWMVRATAVERAATKARIAHRSRALKVRRVVRANEFAPLHVEGTEYKDAPVRDGIYTSVDRDLWTKGGFPTWQRLSEEEDAEKGWTGESYLVYNVAEDSWYHTNSFTPGERGSFDATLPHCLAPVGPVPMDGKWAVTIVPQDKDKKPYLAEHSVGIEVATVHPDFGDAYAKPTGLADLQPFYFELGEMLSQLGKLAHRLTQEEMVKASANAPTLLPLPPASTDAKDSEKKPANETPMEGRLSIADCYKEISKAEPELEGLIDGLTAEQPTTSDYKLGAVSEFAQTLGTWLKEDESVKSGTRTAVERAADESHAGVFMKLLRSEWVPMIEHVVEQSNQFIAEWPRGMGLGALSTLCGKFFAAQDGGCPKLLSEFFAEVVALQAKLQESDEAVTKCKAALEAQAGRITKLATLDDLLSELAPYDDIPDGVTTTLEELLSEFGYGGKKGSDSQLSGGGTSVGRALRCEQAEDNMSALTTNVENDVLSSRKALMKQLTDATDWVEKRLEKLRAMEASATAIQKDVTTEVDGSIERYGTLSKSVNLAVSAFDGKIAAVEAEAKEESLARNRSKNQFREQTGLMQEENSRLAAEVMERLRKIKANEDLMRQAEAADRSAELKHQQTVERHSQNLGALSGCRDEMDTFGQILSKSTEAAKQVKELTSSFLTDHDHSVTKNITRDVERVQARCREWDTDHFATYCEAFEPVHHSRVMLQTAALNVECELAPMRQLVKTAREMRDKVGEASLKKKQTELREQKGVLDADIATVTAHETDLHESVAPAVLGRLQSLREDRDAHLLAVIHEYGFTKPPDTEAHLAMAERVKDKATKLVVTQDVNLTTKRLEAEEKRATKISEFMPSYKEQWTEEANQKTDGAPLALTYAPLSKTVEGEEDRDRPPPSMHAVEAAAAAELVAKRKAEDEAKEAALAEQRAADAKAAQEAKEAADAKAFEEAVAKVRALAVSIVTWPIVRPIHYHYHAYPLP
jgi:hypothetical protein